MGDSSYIETWLQREDEELLHTMDEAVRDEVFFLPGVARIPVHGEHGLMVCPLCGSEGRPLGPKTLTVCTLPSGESGLSHALCCEDGHDYFAWEHEYRVCNFGRHLEYIGTGSFGVRYLYSSERNTFPREHFTRGVL